MSGSLYNSHLVTPTFLLLCSSFMANPCRYYQTLKGLYWLILSPNVLNMLCRTWPIARSSPPHWACWCTSFGLVRLRNHTVSSKANNGSVNWEERSGIDSRSKHYSKIFPRCLFYRSQNMVGIWLFLFYMIFIQIWYFNITFLLK